MKKSHPIRSRALAARRAQQARTLKARHQVEALAALMGYRRAIRARSSPSAWPDFIALLMRRLRQGPFSLAGIFGPTLAYDEGALWKRRA